MLEFISLDLAKETWDNIILKLYNPTFYQSYTYAMNYGSNDQIKFIIQKNDNNINFACFLKEEKDIIKVPFGPIY